uniref:peptidylprolyl isomerase n=1 Tax=Rhizochromulina marina TaxID=1034831 RepID=A0A7S2SVY6_9STRA|mmetsp:Transcript_9871/g.28014  ORF Transcript_9871/g.28014 Transcript_9871/m.28014 type:complete len:163 (+) Transcript_9871:243-731(+)|eukprot:CAMPEP_0118967810 /NCGR_PEP_ID=MMETSP1173-20130426/5145_1 /TAXON_ID=1034831 /ORGANISM="Rhizochromulina marina cf, Strain CCMP1243" /LENGTH=162 /DNA_ID=CAMNT_0006916841 /DNA_START=204 /DNA_END=692 /DNA_ORIENTATION=+
MSEVDGNPGTAGEQHPPSDAGTALSVAATLDEGYSKVEGGGGLHVHLKTVKGGDATNFPQESHTVRLHYVARFKDGTVFDSSRDRDQPITFKLGTGQAIPGLELGVMAMSRGQIAEIVVPPEAGYGATGYLPIIPPNAVLVYEVELISFATFSGEGKANPSS